MKRRKEGKKEGKHDEDSKNEGEEACKTVKMKERKKNKKMRQDKENRQEDKRTKNKNKG